MYFMDAQLTLLKVSPMKDVIQFGKQLKLIQRYIGLIKIQKGVCQCPIGSPYLRLSRVHTMLYVLMLKKCHEDGDYIIHWDLVYYT